VHVDPARSVNNRGKVLERVYVDSKAMKWVAYDPSHRTLEIGFPSGRIYEYFAVPENVYLELTTAESIGEYFNKKVRTAYRFGQIIGPHEEPHARPGSGRAKGPRKPPRAPRSPRAHQ
jgi:KTSC domain